jgi:rhodanese-related sulfurtransferase
VLSPLAARKAEKLGYTRVKTFHAGLPEWRKAGHPVVSNIANIESLNKLDQSFILLDIRSKDAIEKGHIPKAVAAADGKVGPLEDQFPKFKKAAVIIYNQDGDLAKANEVFKTVTGWGYQQVSILDGGFAGWEKAGKEVAKGPAGSEIKYVRKLLPGEIDVVEFKALAEKPSQEYVILDVRNPPEFAAGAIAGAVSMPLEELELRLDKLPKDKTLLVHCGTGARAEMAYNVLKKAGFNVKYLKATVEFDKEQKGKYTID